VITLAAAAIFLVTMGIRQSLGLVISPLKNSTGLGIATISLAFAIAQLIWGAIQPIAGAVADRYGPAKVLIAGLVVLAIGMAFDAVHDFGLRPHRLTGRSLAAGSGASSFSVLIGAASRHLPADKRGKGRWHSSTPGDR